MAWACATGTTRSCSPWKKITGQDMAAALCRGERAR
jgi:hypothetical protein